MSDNEDVPFSSFRGHLKSIHFPDLTPLNRDAFRYIFGRFFEESPVTPGTSNEQYAKAHMATGSFQETEAPYVYRRFAGGTSLPRGRYYSVCDASGADYDTLLCELLYYCDGIFRDWNVVVVDTANRLQTYLYDDLFRRRFGKTLWEHTFYLILMHKRRPRLDPQALDLARYFDSERKQSGGQGARFEFPYRVEEAAIDRTIDLRSARTQRWLHEQLVSGAAPIMYDYVDDGSSTRLLILDPEAEPTVALAQKQGPLVVYQPHVRGDENLYQVSNDFSGVLAHLLTENSGGSPFTEALGRWFRTLGAQAVVYPSARADVLCSDRGGQTKSSGFCLVDYRGVPAPDPRTTLIRKPQTWANHALYDKADVLYGVTDKGAYLRVRGNWRNFYESVHDKAFPLKAGVRTLSHRWSWFMYPFLFLVRLIFFARTPFPRCRIRRKPS